MDAILIKALQKTMPPWTSLYSTQCRSSIGNCRLSMTRQLTGSTGPSIGGRLLTTQPGLAWLAGQVLARSLECAPALPLPNAIALGASITAEAVMLSPDFGTTGHADRYLCRSFPAPQN
jgi:hypothetical protein